MNDDRLRAQQRQNDLDAIRNYEQHISAVYAQSKNPSPTGWICSDHGRQPQRDCQLNALS